MKISIIGASKGVGLDCVKIALSKGHQVTTLSRTPIDIEHHNLKTIQGDATKLDDLRQTIRGTEAIIVTLGRGKDTRATTLFSDFGKAMINLHESKPLKMPVIILSGFGAGDSRAYLPFAARVVFSTILKKVYEDKETLERLITATDIRWEMIRAGMMTDGELTEKYSAETQLSKDMKTRKISRKNTAYFMVKEAESPSFIREYVNLMGAQS